MSVNTFTILEQRYRARMQEISLQWFQRVVTDDEYRERSSMIIDEFQRALDYQNTEDTTLIPDKA